MAQRSSTWVAAVWLLSIGGGVYVYSTKTRDERLPVCAWAPGAADRVLVSTPEGRKGTVERGELVEAVAAGASVVTDDDMAEVSPVTSPRCRYSASKLAADIEDEDRHRRARAEAEERARQEAARQQEAQRAAAALNLMRARDDALPRYAAEQGFAPAGAPVAYGAAPAYYAPASTAGHEVNVHGYTRRDGTYVAPHTRAAPGHGRR